MWSKMATRWRRKDGHLKPGKGCFLSNNNPNEFVLNTDIEMNTQSSVDHSILAIFEDSSVLTQERAAVEEDSEQLLSALTEMLESVEDDYDNLSPFNTLPETSLLTSQDLTDNAKFMNTKVESEVEVFTTASLVNLVNLMHPYCLKLQVEEEPGKSTKNVLFSKEEVWKYERPTEEIDEEINVVSDDEASIETTQFGKEQDKNNKPLKSALFSSSPSKGHHLPKEKKRVSFGSVQVNSFDLESQTSGITSLATHHSSKALNNTTDSTLQSQISSENSQMFDARPQKSEKKRKSLSLQQYRQLREKRQPLVEKQGNYTTKWPSVSVPPKELTPILSVQGQKLAVFKPFTIQQSTDKSPVSKVPPKTRLASSDVLHKAKRHKSICKVSPIAPLPGVNVDVCKESPTKTPTVLSSDPPNPVLLPLPVKNEPTSDIKQNENSDVHHSEDVSEITDDSTPKCNNQSSTEDDKLIPNTLDLTNHCNDVMNVKMPLDCPPSIPYTYEPPTPVSTPVKEQTPEVAFRISPPLLQLCNPLSTSSGIIASDLTSLLEQFEETQAKEEGESERALQVHTEHTCELKSAAPNSVQTNQVLPPDPALLTPRTEALTSTSHSTASLTPLCSRPNLKIPEPLGTEVVLSTQEQPARKKPQVKSIKIIDPRPLPYKKTYSSISESAVYSPSHIYASISSDHDYCSASKSVTENAKTLNATSENMDVKHANLSAPNACSNQISEANKSKTVTTFENVLDISRTKRPTNQCTLSVETAKNQPSSLPDVRLDTCIPPTPPPSPPYRGRGQDRRTFRRRSHRSDSSSSSSSSSSSYSSSSSRSCSPISQTHHHQSSDSSSCSSSPSRSASRSPPRHKWSKMRFSRSRSRSRSRSWSRSRSRSRSQSQSPHRKIWKDVSRNREARKLRREQEVRMQKLRAIDERRVVYVGRIRRTMTHEELRERFSQFGQVECVSLHFRDRGDHYGFVTFYNMEDAFSAIDNGGKLRRPDELPFDICFGGRRQFCNSDYADLDSNRDAELSPVRSRYEDVDFDLLLKQAQKGLKS